MSLKIECCAFNLSAENKEVPVGNETRFSESRSTWLLHLLQKANLGTHWWVWVQFGVLCASLAANVALWFYAQHRSAQAAAAEYNNLAWVALTEFQKDSGDLSKRFEAEVRPHLESAFSQPPEEWSENTEEIVTHWVEDAALDVTKLKMQLANYEAILHAEPAASGFAREAIQRLLPLSNMVTSALLAKTEQLERTMKVLNESLGGLPHPGPRMDVQRRLDRFDRAYAAAQTISKAAPRPHAKWVEY